MSIQRIIASDFHFGRKGYETPLGSEVKQQSAMNIGDFLSAQDAKPPITIVGDLFHRPHWDKSVAERNGESFDSKKSAQQIGSLAEVLRQGYALTLLDGNCDPWTAMSGFNVDVLIHAHLLDEREKIAITFAGLSDVEQGTFYTHGHAAEDMQLLVRNALHIPSDAQSLEVGQKLHGILANPDVFNTLFEQHDADGGSLFHHIVCQTLLRLEKLEKGIFERIMPNTYVRRIGNETLAQVIAHAGEQSEGAIDTAVFGHTHQMSKLQVDHPSMAVWNPGSATGDLHVRPYGTFLVEDEQGITPYYSWHPDNPKKVIPVPEDHLSAFSKGRRGQRCL